MSTGKVSKQLEIQTGRSYSNGKRKRYVTGLCAYFVLYVTPSSKGTTTGIPMWDFKKWAKRECSCKSKQCTCEA